jgi:aconitate hydratase
MRDPNYSGDLLELSLDSVVPSLSGPKRPHDRVTVANMKKDWNECLTNKVGFKGFGLKPENVEKSSTFNY